MPLLCLGRLDDNEIVPLGEGVKEEEEEGVHPSMWGLCPY